MLFKGALDKLGWDVPGVLGGSGAHGLVTTIVRCDGIELLELAKLGWDVTVVLLGDGALGLLATIVC